MSGHLFNNCAKINTEFIGWRTMTWASGQHLQGGKYTIAYELGKGGFGITYRAKDNDGRLVVTHSPRMNPGAFSSSEK